MHRKQFKPKRSDTRRHTVVMKIYTCHRVHRITQEGIWNEQVYNFNILAKLARMFLLYRGNYTKVTWSWETIHTCSGIRFFPTSTFRTSWLFKAFFRGGEGSLGKKRLGKIYPWCFLSLRTFFEHLPFHLVVRTIARTSRQIYKREESKYQMNYLKIHLLSLL